MDEREVKGTAREFAGKAEQVAGNVTGDTGRQAEGHLDEGVGAAERKFGAAREAAQDAAETASRQAAEARDAAFRAAERAAERLDREAELYGDRGITSAISDFVRERPVAATLGAVGIGVALAVVLRNSLKS